MRSKIYAEKSDEQLVDEYNATQDDAIFEELLERTEGLRKSLAKEYSNIPGSELEDLLQEGMMEMFRVIRYFDSSKSAAFTTFLYSAISRRYNTLYVKATCKARNPEQVTTSYEHLNGLINNECAEDWKGYGKVCFSVECKEFALVEFEDVIARSGLSDRERLSIQLTLRGNTKPEIAKIMNVKTPTVHSYLRRTYNKLRVAII
ncbi:MAG: sigma-70 family RNA polymerase sigma factor [Clostridiales bacterium]|nr:sigma-70 family RNA polymerase sigma factor [Clostridiales bacterium]